MRLNTASAVTFVVIITKKIYYYGTFSLNTASAVTFGVLFIISITAILFGSQYRLSSNLCSLEKKNTLWISISSQYRLSSNLCSHINYGKNNFDRRCLNTASAVTFVVIYGKYNVDRRSRLNTASAVTFVVTNKTLKL